MKKVVIAGATGLIGSALIQLLLRDERIKEIIALTRKPINIENHKLKSLVINFDRLNEISDQIRGDAIYFCLGTTKSKTPDNQIYTKIEHDYSLTLGKIALHNRITQFHYISALGADASSSIFYNRIKGITEQALKKLNIPSLHIYQPSLLVGKRSEVRITERIMQLIMHVINPLLKGALKKYQSINATTIASAMLNQTHKGIEGTYIYPSDKIKELA